jgi:PAS domain S-box-containing protein
MRVQSKIWTSIAASIAVSVVIACLAFSIMRGMSNDFTQYESYGKIINEAFALNILVDNGLKAENEESGERNLQQIGEVRETLSKALGSISSSNAREESLLRQIRKNNKELAPLIDQLFDQRGQSNSNIDTERRNLLASQLWIKVRLVTDDIYRLMETSKTRIVSALGKTTFMVVILICVALLSKSFIYFLSTRSIVVAQKALQESEERYRITLSSIGDAVIATDAAGLITFINPVAASLTGWENNETRGLMIEEVFRIINEQTRKPAEDIVRCVLRDGQVAQLANHTALLSRDGREIPIEDSAAPIVDKKGELLGAVLVFHDVTKERRAQEELRESEARLDLALRSARMGTWHWDVTENRRYLDDQACHLLGIDPATFTGTAEEFFQALHPGDRETIRRALARTLEQDVPYETEYRAVRPDGNVRYIAARGKLVPDDKGRPIRLNGIIWDISERKQMEEELHRSRDELELRVRERTSALRTTVTRLELINQELQDFAFAASHDLQEPLRKIQTFCDMTKKRCAPALDSVGQDYLEKVINSAARMRQLLSDLLLFSRVATRPEPFKEVDLGEIAREAADVFEARVKEIGALVEIENTPAVEADEVQMLQLFQNLIGNALKYRGEETLSIKVCGKLDEHGGCEIRVTDNGIGFDQQFAERIFKPFQRLHSHKAYEGTGMGLAICRKIAERHGGSIRAESVPGKGSTFIIILPVRQHRWEGIQ